MLNRLKHHLNLLFIAWTFYTRIPLPFQVDHNPEKLQLSRAYFPWIGVLVGSFCALIFVVSAIFWHPSIAVLFSMLASIWITGAFHEDGLADSTDALGGGWSRNRILEIMKDSRIGTFGTVALIFILALKFAASYSIASQSSVDFALILIFAHTASRYLASSLVDFMRNASSSAMSKSKPMASTRLPRGYRIIGLAALVFSALILYDRPLMILGFFPALAMTFYWIRLIRKWLGGYTGDTLGALQQLTEVTIYLTAAMSWNYI